MSEWRGDTEKDQLEETAAKTAAAKTAAAATADLTDLNSIFTH